jgi:phosphoribosylanthranilate isomerase
VSLFVKICGVSDVATGLAAVEAGADAIGFVFADSPRQVSPRRALAISGELPAGILRVAVFRHPAPGEIDAVLEQLTPDLVQADYDTLGAVHDIETLPVYRDGVDGVPDDARFLYEGPMSGLGQLVNLQRAAGIARLGEMILAGGLRPDNVGRAITAVRPFGVDVSSGVETSPGTKDPALIRSFVAAVRAAEERLVSA